MHRLLGNTVALAAVKQRKYPTDRIFQGIAPAYHPAVILTKKQQGIKTQICHHLTEQGNVLLPAAEDTEYLVRGQPKGVPITFSLRALRQSRFQTKSFILEVKMNNFDSFIKTKSFILEWNNHFTISRIRCLSSKHDSKFPKVGNTQRRPNVYKCLPGQGKYTHANGNTDLHTKPLHQSRQTEGTNKKRKRPRWRSQALSRPKPQWIQDWSHKPNCMVATKHKCHSRWRWCQWKLWPAASAMHLHQNLHRHTSYQTEPSSGYANRAKI